MQITCISSHIFLRVFSIDLWNSYAFLDAFKEKSFVTNTELKSYVFQLTNSDRSGLADGLTLNFSALKSLWFTSGTESRGQSLVKLKDAVMACRGM